MTDDTNFPTVSEGTIGGALVQTVNGRELHRTLKVGRDYSNWVKGRITEYDFTEGVDFVRIEVLANSGENPSGRPRVDYAITLDMAKELAMVERNEEGKRVRRYFIECEKRLRSALPSEALESLTRTNGICRMLANKVTSMEKAIPEMAAKIAAELLPAMVQSALGAQNFMVRRGKTAGQIWRDHSFPRIRVTGWFGNRLAEMGCAIEGGGCGELGTTKARLFDPDKADAWLRNGGSLKVNEYIAKRRGQTVLSLVPQAKPEH